MVTAHLVRADGQRRVEQQDAVLGPLRQIAVFWDLEPRDLVRHLFVNVPQRWRDPHTLAHRECQALQNTVVSAAGPAGLRGVWKGD